MRVAGIDPGFSGAIAIYGPTSPPFSETITDVYSMPILKNVKNEIDEQELVRLLKDVDCAFIEKAQAMPGQGISSTGRYMMSFGIVRGICAALKIPYTLVIPQRWKKALIKDMPKGKDSSLIVAARSFPDINFGRNHNKAEAALIALYGVSTLLK